MTDTLTPIEPETKFPRPLANLRKYVVATLYLETDDPVDLRLLVESTVPPFTDDDVYAARISGPDLREAKAAFAGTPVEQYVPAHRVRRDPVTGENETTIEVGASDGDPTSVSASNAPLNHWILQQQPKARPYLRRVPRSVVLDCVDTLAADDIQALRNLWLLSLSDSKGHRKLTVAQLVHKHGYSARSVHRHHNAAVAHLLRALLAWHATHPEARRQAA